MSDNNITLAKDKTDISLTSQNNGIFNISERKK